MKNISLLVIVAAVSLAFPARAAPPEPRGKGKPVAEAPRGVPFDRLQRQIDRLRQRVHELEATRPAGQSCPEGQFVTGFSTTGTLLCAMPVANPPPPPPPPPPPITSIPDSFRLALQQALEGLAGVDRPLESVPQTVQTAFGQLTYQPLRYDLAIGQMDIAQPSAATATIQLPIPLVVVDVLVAYEPLNLSETLIASASGLANVQVTVVTTPSGSRRLSSVSAVDLVPSSINVTGAGVFGPVVSIATELAQDALLNSMEQELRQVLNQYVLPQLPEF